MLKSNNSEIVIFKVTDKSYSKNIQLNDKKEKKDIYRCDNCNNSLSYGLGGIISI